MVRIATFNVENLFARYNFRSNFNPVENDGFTVNDIAYSIYNDVNKKITALAIKDVNADVICLQEVESMAILEKFNSEYLASLKYKYRMLIDSHDPRKIDVAVLSKHPIIYARSYRDERNDSNTTWKFSRDCLEVNISIDSKLLTVYVNHFKSLMGGRSNTYNRRKEQVDRVSEIITDHWKDKDYDGNFIVLGDFNDYLDNQTSLTSLVNHEGLVNVSKDLSSDEGWTHYWASGGSYSQLDFILISKTLAENNDNIRPEIMRKGLPWRADKYTGERFDEVGEDSPKASDHAPLFIDLQLL